MQTVPLPSWLTIEFPERLVYLRKHKQLTQQGLAEAAGVKSLDPQALRVRQGPPDAAGVVPARHRTRRQRRCPVVQQGRAWSGNYLRLHFEAVSRMSPEEQQVVRSLIEGIILKHDSKPFKGNHGS